MKNTFVLIICFFLSLSLLAQTPEGFNYQGVARDLSGNPIGNQNIGLRIAILKGTATGTEVYKELHLVVTNDLGLFSIQVGKGTPISAIFANIDWGDQSHFLQIEMDETGGSNYKLVGTSQLMSVPYALYAKNAENAENGGLWETNSNGDVFVDKPLSANVAVGFQTSSIHPNTGKTIESFVGFREFRNTWQTENTPPTNSYPGPMIYLTQKELGRTWPQDRTVIVRSEDALEFRISEQLSAGPEPVDFIFTENGEMGIGTTQPKSKLQIANGDVFIQDINKGVIMKSPNGQCWRVTVDNTGGLVSTSVTCPN